MKFAFVTPRYGGEITSGPEHACRLLAEQVCERHEVEVLTTSTRDPRTWKNEYGEGADRVQGVLVRRFAVSEPHDREQFRQVSERLASGVPGRADELEWVRRLGPWSPGLMEHLRRQQRSFDAVFFFSLRHATTVHGIAAVPDRSIAFPFLTVDRVFRFGLWSDVLLSAAGVGYMSASERRVTRSYLGLPLPTEEIVGVGIDSPPQLTYPRHQQDPADTVAEDDAAPAEPSQDLGHLSGRGVPFRRRHRLYGSFALYGGKVEPDNGCEELLDYFDSYAAAHASAALVLMGVKMMKVPEQPWVRMAGVLPDRERMVAYEAADVSVVPASDDLVAQPLLESLAVGTPVLASARNDAAVDHLRRSNGGLYYGNREEFVGALTLLMNDARLRERLGENGRQYIRQHHRWDAVLGRFERLANRVRGRG